MVPPHQLSNSTIAKSNLLHSLADTADKCTSVSRYSSALYWHCTSAFFILSGFKVSKLAWESVYVSTWASEAVFFKGLQGCVALPGSPWTILSSPEPTVIFLLSSERRVIWTGKWEFSFDYSQSLWCFSFPNRHQFSFFWLPGLIELRLPIQILLNSDGNKALFDALFQLRCNSSTTHWLSQLHYVMSCTSRCTCTRWGWPSSGEPTMRSPKARWVFHHDEGVGLTYTFAHWTLVNCKMYPRLWNDAATPKKWGTKAGMPAGFHN